MSTILNIFKIYIFAIWRPFECLIQTFKSWNSPVLSNSWQLSKGCVFYSCFSWTFLSFSVVYMHFLRFKQCFLHPFYVNAQASYKLFDWPTQVFPIKKMVNNTILTNFNNLSLFIILNSRLFSYIISRSKCIEHKFGSCCLECVFFFCKGFNIVRCFPVKFVDDRGNLIIWQIGHNHNKAPCVTQSMKDLFHFDILDLILMKKIKSQITLKNLHFSKS